MGLRLHSDFNLGIVLKINTGRLLKCKNTCSALGLLLDLVFYAYVFELAQLSSNCFCIRKIFHFPSLA